MNFYIDQLFWDRLKLLRWCSHLKMFLPIRSLCIAPPISFRSLVRMRTFGEVIFQVNDFLNWKVEEGVKFKLFCRIIPRAAAEETNSYLNMNNIQRVCCWVKQIFNRNLPLFSFSWKVCCFRLTSWGLVVPSMQLIAKLMYDFYRCILTAVIHAFADRYSWYMV